MFEYLDEILEIEGCNDTLMRTIEFLKNNKLSVQSTLEWLSINGAYYDCEVLANVEDKISEI